jgi:hypothetical protein
MQIPIICSHGQSAVHTVQQKRVTTSTAAKTCISEYTPLPFSKQNLYILIRFIFHVMKNKLPLLQDQANSRSQMTLLTWDRGHDNMLLGQGYRRPHGVVTDGYGAMVE